MSDLRIYTCGEWGAKPITRTFSRQKAVSTVVHHTAGPNTIPVSPAAAEEQRCFRLARSIQQAHLNRGWSDSGHHFLVCRSGLILEGRHGSYAGARAGAVVQGAHAGDAAANRTSFGIENEGLFRTSGDITNAQWGALVNLCAYLAYWGDYQTQDIYPHNRYRRTACPGALEAMLPDLRKAAHDKKLELLSCG